MKIHPKNGQPPYSIFYILHSERNGQATLEMLLALSVLVLCTSAAVIVSFGSQSTSIDSETSHEALYKAGEQLESARALSRGSFAGVFSYDTTSSIYASQLSVEDITQCLKQVTSSVTWVVENRPQRVALGSLLGDVPGVFAAGGDCFIEPPDSNWDNPSWFAKDTFGPKPTAIDVLHKIAYLGIDNNPFFYIADARDATFGQTSFVPGTSFVNDFDAGAQINSLDVVERLNPVTGIIKTYVFAAMESDTAQLEVIDVTDIYNPKIVATSSLNATIIPAAKRVDPAGDNPQGKKIYYFDNKIYIGLWRTLGPEFHVYDVSSATNPIWLGSREMNHNVKDIVARGDWAYLAMTASDGNDKELAILNVKSPASITPAFVFGAPEPWGYNATGTGDGLAEFVIGNKLYLGREKGSNSDESEFLILDVSSPTSTIPLLASKYIGDDVTDIYVTGPLAFTAVEHANQEFRVWKISNYPITNIAIYNFGNVISGGFDYEPDFIYTTGKSTPNFQILYDQ